MDMLSYILSRKYVDKAIKKLKKETTEQSVDKEVIKDIIQESEVNSDIWKVQGKVGAKNLLVYPYNTNSYSGGGVSFIVNDDGSVNASGTTEATSAEFPILTLTGKQLLLKAGTYIFSDGLPNGSAAFTNLLIRDSLNSWNSVLSRSGSLETPFEITDEMASKIASGEYRIQIKLCVRANRIVDNAMFYPMIRYASDTDDTWQPYAPTNKELATKINDAIDQINKGGSSSSGKDGKDGKSAYQIAVDNGYSGTEQEWLASLKGEPLTYDDLTTAQKHEIIGGAFEQKTRNILEASQLLNNTAIQLWGNPTISNYTYESQGKTTTIPIDCNEGDIFKAVTANSRQVNFGYITFNENGVKVRFSDAVSNNITIEADETKIAFYFTSHVPAAMMLLSNIDEYPIYEPYGNKPKYQEIGYTNNYRPCDYIGDEITMLNKILFIGDSFVEGVFEYTDNGVKGYIKSDDFNLVSNLSRMTGLKITNKGDGGTTCATWYNHHANDDLSGHKACFIALGINDTLKQENGWDNDSDVAMTQIVQKVRNENGENIPIFIATIPAGYYYAMGTFDATNARIRSIANTLDAYIVDLGADNNIVYDFHLYGGHPNSYGYHEIAKEWRAWISYIIATRDSKFRDLQFVGTEYRYN